MYNVSRAWHELPELTEVNRLPMHGAEIPFADPANARSFDYANSPHYLSLDGKWQFKLFASTEKAEEGFCSADYNDSKWKSIKVPSNWTLQNVGDKPIYTNVTMPFVNFPPIVPDENPTGIYRVSFKIPRSWSERRVIIHIGAAESVLEVWCNGTFIGMGKDCRLPSEFDLTDVANFDGENLLCCRVTRWSDGSYIEDQDQWYHAGIYRSCYLYSTEKIYLEDIFSLGDLDCRRGTGVLTVKSHIGVFVTQLTQGQPHERSLRMDMTGPLENMKVVSTLYYGDTEVWQNSETLDSEFRKSGYVVEQIGKIRNVKQWSTENPELYMLVVELFDASGKRLDCRRKRVGFRHIEVKGTDLLINGARVLIKGVNRHEHDVKNGKTLTYERMVEEIKILKSFNFNAIRTCHYPDDHRWYDLCDEYGLYVLDEANMEAHANYATLCRTPRWSNSFVERGKRMVLRDRSHCCVFCWSVGNESGFGENIIAEIDAMRALDASRPIMNEGEVKPHFWQRDIDWKDAKPEWNAFFDPMYPELSVLKNYVESASAKRPAILCEYAHAMGNSSGSLCDYWDMFYRYPKLQGGFIWDWIDQGLEITEKDGKRKLGYGGDFGEKVHDFDFCCNGMMSADLKPHPAMFEFRHLTQPIKIELVNAKNFKFKLVNRQDFSDLSNFVGGWWLEINGKKVQSGSLPELNVQSGKSAAFTLSVKSRKLYEGDTAYINFEFKLKKATSWANAGTLLAHDQYDVQCAFKQLSKVTLKRPLPHKIVSTNETIDLICGKDKIMVNKTTGDAQLFHNGKLVVADLFVANFFRAGTDNDGIRGWTGQKNKLLNQWLEAGLDKMRVNCAEITPRKDSLQIVKIYQGSNSDIEIKTIENISFSATGFVFLFDFYLSKCLPSMPRIGIMAKTVEGFEKVSYFGRGPWENYIDRCRSAQMGLYQTTVSEMYEDGYILPQENGNRTGVSFCELSSSNITLRISADLPFEFGASHSTPQELYAIRHQSERVEHKETFLTLDLQQRGLGTGSCGPQTLPEYCIDGKEYHFRFALETK